MKDIEKIARDICWSEFLAPRNVGQTKAEYWKSLLGSKRAEYMKDAQKFVFWLGRIPIGTLNIAHKCEIIGAKKSKRNTWPVP